MYIRQQILKPSRSRIGQERYADTFGSARVISRRARTDVLPIPADIALSLRSLKRVAATGPLCRGGQLGFRHRSGILITVDGRARLFLK